MHAMWSIINLQRESGLAEKGDGDKAWHRVFGNFCFTTTVIVFLHIQQRWLPQLRHRLHEIADIGSSRQYHPTVSEDNKTNDSNVKLS